MQKNLVIVESPAKAKTIEKFLGKDYKVMSSYGHIRDLKEKEFSIDIDHDYAPKYVIPADKRKVVVELKSAAENASTVWLASDEDREGEAIAWHLSEVLSLKTDETKRIVFHEITKNAILHAIENPRHIDMNLVNAQQARRVLDRIVGFQLSPILWKKVKPALSAGRVQSVAVRLIVEREREINEFAAEAAFRVTASFLLPDGETLKAELNRRFKDGIERTEPRHLKIDVVVRNGCIKEFRSNLPCGLRGFAGYGCIPRAFGDAVLILKGVIHGFDDAFGRNIRSGFRENKFIIGTGSERMKTLLDRDGDKVAGNLS